MNSQPDCGQGEPSARARPDAGRGGGGGGDRQRPPRLACRAGRRHFPRPLVHASRRPRETSPFAAVETESQTKLVPHSQSISELRGHPRALPLLPGLKEEPQEDPPCLSGQLARDPSAGLASGSMPGRTAEPAPRMPILSSPICEAVRNCLAFSAELPGRGLAGFSAGPEQAQRGDPVSRALTSLTQTSGGREDPPRRTLRSLGGGHLITPLSQHQPPPRECLGRQTPSKDRVKQDSTPK